MKVNGNLTLNTGGDSQLENVIIDRVASDPSVVGAEKGRIIFNTTSGVYKFNDGTQWTTFATGGNAAALQTEVDAIETSLGSAVNGSGVFQASAFDSFNNVTTPTSITNVLSQLDAAIAGKDALSELTDVGLSSTADNDLLQFNSTTGKWENTAIGSASGVQAYDAGLAALATFNTNGILVQTADNTFAGRSLVAPAAGITITDPAGVAGNPTFVLANDLAAVEGLATFGFAVRDTADHWVTRQVQTGSSGRIVVSNGDGVAGDPSIDLATVTDAGTGTFLKFTRDSYGRVSGTTAVVQADITGLVDSVYVNVDGDSMTGALDMGGNKITSLGTPTSANDGATKGYVDSLAGGLSWQEPVVGVVATNPVSGMTAGNRYLNTTDDKIYTALTATTVDAGVSPADGWALFDKSDESGYVFNGTDWVQFTGTGQITAGTGLLKTGNVLDINLGAGIVELPTDEVGIDLYSSAAGAIILTTDGSARSTASGSKLHLLLKAAGGLTQDATGLYVPAAGITNAMLANSSTTINVDSGGGSDTLSLGETFTIFGHATSGVYTTVSTGTAGPEVVVAVHDASSTQKGVASFDTGAFTVNAGNVVLTASLDDLTNVSASDAAATGDLLTKTAGDWQPVSRADLMASVGIDSLSDVSIATAAENQALIYDATASQWKNQNLYFLYTSGAAATSHTVTHNIGQKYCNVTVVDSTDEVIIPQSITFNSATGLTVTFTSAINCKVVVMGVA